MTAAKEKAQMRKLCRCESCRFTDRVARVQAKLSRRDAAVIEKLLVRWANVSTDATYYKAKLDGTWPDGPK